MNSIRRAVAAIAAASVASLALAGFATESQSKPEPLKPCKHEWSNNCYWDGSKRDNGNGRSFIADADGNVTYIGEDSTITWNKGYVESKRDDCEQGFQIACVWLDNQH